MMHSHELIYQYDSLLPYTKGWGYSTTGRWPCLLNWLVLTVWHQFRSPWLPFWWSSLFPLIAATSWMALQAWRCSSVHNGVQCWLSRWLLPSEWSITGSIYTSMCIIAQSCFPYSLRPLTDHYLDTEKNLVSRLALLFEVCVSPAVTWWSIHCQFVLKMVSLYQKHNNQVCLITIARGIAIGKKLL
jgi:hypothetical protein